MRVLGSAGKGKSFGNGAEVAKLVEFHGIGMSRPKRSRNSNSPAVSRFGYRLCLSIVSELGIGTMAAESLSFEAAETV